MVDYNERLDTALQFDDAQCKAHVMWASDAMRLHHLSLLSPGTISFKGWAIGKNEKEYSWHVPAMKFIGMKQLV